MAVLQLKVSRAGGRKNEKNLMRKHCAALVVDCMFCSGATDAANYCCMACYEKYVGGMRACYSDFHLGKSEIGALSNIDNWLQLDEAILGLSLGEMDYIIEQGRFLTSAMNRLRIEECKDAMRE